MQTNLVIKMDDELVKIFQSICMVRRTTIKNNILVKEVFLTQIKSDEEDFATLSQDDLEKIITGNFEDELEIVDYEVYQTFKNPPLSGGGFN